MSWPLYKIVFGLRHRRTFAFTATSGRIIDSLIARNSAVPNEALRFHEIARSPDGNNVRLRNRDGNYYLDINIDGFVLTYHMLEADARSADEIATQFRGILDSSLHLTEANNLINRIGIMNYFFVNTKDNAARLLFSSITKLQMAGLPDSFTTRFAIKNVTSEGLVDTTKNDYSNVIFQISSEKPQEDKPLPANLIDFSIDYQIYFDPERRYTSALVDKHFANSNLFIQDLVHNRTLPIEAEKDAE